jgi:hypothetical protein
VPFPNMNITGNRDLIPVGRQYMGYNDALLSMDTLMTLCEDPAQQGLCRAANQGGFLKTWAQDPNYQSFLSNTTCGTQGFASLSPGTAISPPGTQYLVCSSPGTADAVLVTFAIFELPPFLVEQACDKNPECVGFIVDTAQTQGWLLQYWPVRPTNAEYAFFIVRLS